MRRLAPALIAIVVAVVAASVFFGDWWFEPGDLLPVLLYYGNWVEATPGPGDLGALGITWSLAIEEQFCLLWPLVVAVLARRRWVTVAALGFAGVSLLWRLVLMADGADLEGLYYGSDTVAFGLLVGAVVVGLRMAEGPGRSSRSLLAAAVGVGAWAASWEHRPFLLLGVPLVSFAAGVALWACTGAGRIAFLEWGWLRWFGSRSYGLYLWHGPILWAMRDHFGLSWPVVAGAGIPLSLLLAEASFRWIESPFRRRSPATSSGPPLSSTAVQAPFGGTKAVPPTLLPG